VSSEREADRRRHPRARITWSVTVEVGDKVFNLETVDLSPVGAKLGGEGLPLVPGTSARLHFRHPERQPLDVRAIVWRNDPDGTAFFFIGVEAESPELPFPPAPR